MSKYVIKQDLFNCTFGSWHVYCDDCWLGSFYSEQEAKDWINAQR